jgi:hypothetical protein
MNTYEKHGGVGGVLLLTKTFIAYAENPLAATLLLAEN